jgi:predicted nucleic acid binding AN1-type Zn finger protein
MKNKPTLIVASLLLLLCVLQKESRYNALRNDSVEKMYNSPSDNSSVISLTEKSKSKKPDENYALKNTHLFEFASADSASANTATSSKLMNQNLLNISSGNKLLDL